MLEPIPRLSFHLGWPEPFGRLVPLGRLVLVVHLVLLGCLAPAGCVGAVDGEPNAPSRGRPAEARWQEIEHQIRSEFADVRHVTTDEVAAQLDSADRAARPILLDVRTAEEFAVSHLPGAVHVEPDTPADRLALIVANDRPVLCYCSVGYRSAVMAQRIAGLDRTRDVRNYLGSIFAWANAGRRLVDGAGRAVEVVHPYDDDWGSLLQRARHAPR